MPRLINADALTRKLHARLCKVDNGRSYRRESVPVAEGLAMMELEFCIGLVQCEPVIEAEPVRHGEWVLFGADKRGRGGVFQCTACSRCRPHKSDYCPNCGAKMDKEG